ncbi:MAG: hypothetical protein ACPG32_00805 [Akkermansiaceae bacterium]
MSLKGFHILFITIATLLCVFVALWAFFLLNSASLGVMIFGASCAIAAVCLPIYGVRFYKKANDINL